MLLLLLISPSFIILNSLILSLTAPLIKLVSFISHSLRVYFLTVSSTLSVNSEGISSCIQEAITFAKTSGIASRLYVQKPLLIIPSSSCIHSGIVSVFFQSRYCHNALLAKVYVRIQCHHLSIQ